MTVMGKMEEAEILRREYQQKAAQPADGVIEPTASEGRTVNGLVKRREQGDEDDPVQHRGRHGPPTVDAKGEQRPGRQEQRAVTGEMAQSACIRPAVQVCKSRTIDAAMGIDDFIHASSIARI
jgi:hypothetical protein